MKSLPDQSTSEAAGLSESALKVVGIGASAGGLEALTTFFMNLPLDSGFAFIVVTHLSPDRPSLLPELLQKNTQTQTIRKQYILSICSYVQPCI